MRRVVKTKCRIKKHIMYYYNSFKGKSGLYIKLWPQQIWIKESSCNKGCVRLVRGCVSIYIPKIEFDEDWEVIDDGKNE